MKRVIEPFRGWRFDEEKVDLSRVIVPPPGVLKVVDPRNARELTEPEVEGDDPTFARRALRQSLFLGAWQKAGVIDRDEEPALYFLRGERSDGSVVNNGFFSRVLASAPVSLLAPEPSRVAWERERAAAFAVEPELVVLGHDDDEGEVARLFRGELDREGDLRFDDLGVGWELWVVDDETTIARVQARMREQRLSILSGTERVAAAAEVDGHVLAFITSFKDISSTLNPVHLEVHTDKEGASLGLLSILDQHFITDNLDDDSAHSGAIFHIKGRGRYAISPRDDDGRPFVLELSSVLDAADVEVRRVQSREPVDDAWACFLELPAPAIDELVAHRGKGNPLPRGLFVLEPEVPRGLVIASRNESQ